MSAPTPVAPVGRMRFPAAVAALAGIVLASGGLEAQGGVPAYDELRTPTSPAFTVLGISPAEVEHPSTTSAFSTSFLNSFADGAEAPRSFALETAPFWWLHHPALTFEAYQGRGLRSLYQDMTLSVAVTDSAPAGREVGEGFQRAGIGLRLPVVFGTQPAPACVGALLRRLAEVRQPATARFAQILAQNPALVRRIQATPAFGDTLYQRAVGEVLGADSVLVSPGSVERCAAALSTRHGFVLDLAGGVGFNFADGQASSGRVGAGALWANPAYLSDWGGVAGVLRGRWDDLDLEDDEGTSALDLGARLIRSEERWNVSGEGVFRHRVDGASADNLMRLSAIFDLQIGSATWLTLTFGRDFDADEPQSLLALVNFQWNVGGTRPGRPAGLAAE